MKKGRLSADDQAHARLLEFWRHRPEYGDPVGCVTTTYTFDAAFFEEQCLARFLAIDSDSAEDARTYLLEREDKLAQTFAAVLVDQNHVPLARSLRWHALPVRLPHGILHAKLSLLVWRHHVRVLVGSANMTEPGYRSNLENLAVLDFDEAGGVPLTPLRGALELIDDVRRHAPGLDSSHGPQPALARFLATVRRQIDTWSDTDWSRGAPSAWLLATGPTPDATLRPHLFAQLSELWKQHRFAPATQAWVMSPFFDDGDDAADTAHELDKILIQRGTRELHFIVSGDEHPDGLIELDLPRCLADTSSSRAERRVHRVVPTSEHPHRRLHAKSIWLERGQQAIHCLGSSNFTAAGTGWRTSGPKNIEIDLAYVLPDTSDPFARVCALAYPPYKSVKPGDNVSYRQREDRTTEPESHALLHAAFGGALFVPASPHAHLELEIFAPAPIGFAVTADDGAPLIDEGQWHSHGAPALVEVPWTTPRPASHLLVTWTDDAGERCAIWTVNVSDSARLLPPQDLRELDLEALLEVLASARPAHEILGRLLARRKALARRGSGPEVDPHNKVDTRHFLLKRVRRVSAALEQLRIRISKPVYSIEALRWRIEGPYGPLALADRLVAEEPQAAVFFLAEIADTLHSTSLEVHGDLELDEARAVLDAALTDLAAKARALEAPPNLADYVDRALQELGR